MHKISISEIEKKISFFFNSITAMICIHAISRVPVRDSGLL